MAGSRAGGASGGCLTARAGAAASQGPLRVQVPTLFALLRAFCCLWSAPLLALLHPVGSRPTWLGLSCVRTKQELRAVSDLG